MQCGEGVSRVLIVGAGKLGHALAAWLEENRRLGYAVCGFLDPHPNASLPKFSRNGGGAESNGHRPGGWWKRSEDTPGGEEHEDEKRGARS